MKKRYKLFASLGLLGMLLSCSSKGGTNPIDPIDPPGDDTRPSAEICEGAGEDEVTESLSLPTDVSEFTLDNADHSSDPEAPTSLIRVHYRRTDNDESYSNYIGWRIWSWDSAGGGTGWWYEFTKYDEYGVICEIPIEDVAANHTATSGIGLVITTCASKTETWSGDYSKDPDADIMADILPVVPGGIQDLYVKSGDATCFYSRDSVFMSTIKYARYATNDSIKMMIATKEKAFKFYPSRLNVSLDGQTVTNYQVINPENTFVGGGYQVGVTIKFPGALDMSKKMTFKYRITNEVETSADAIITNYYDSVEFKNAYNYDGNDLGVTFDNDANPSKTIFKVWSPLSSSMKLNIYNSGDYREEETPEIIDMVKGDKGVWAAEVEQDLSGKYYTYTVTNSVGTNEVVDPYAKSAGLNGRRGMIVNFAKLNALIEGWDEDVRPNFGLLTQASIYEIHVRDMTINPNSGVSEANRGHYLGLTETGTTYVSEDGVEVTTGLDHLAELGITHVQIQPTYDYSSVDESLPTNVMSKTNYNWGYDPQNYNVLEGGYSSNPSDGANRIIEFKKMVMALHSKGIGIIMDVVYNHTSSFSQSNFEMLVPNYYHRTKNSGVPYNGSGCGNEMASDRYMVNKFMRESCKFWTDEYHLGGFRFDLMGLMDNQVMIDIYNDCHEIDNNILIYGEPWTGGNSKLVKTNNPIDLANQQTVQSSLNQSYFAGSEVYVGAFSDGFRNAARGGNEPKSGYVQGVGSSSSDLVPGFMGLFNSSDTNVAPHQVINYVSCHDNYTLYDQLIQTNSNGHDLNKAYSQAETLVFAAQGVAFMQEGEDFMRSKAYIDESGKTKYEGNSYNVGDFINNMDYALKAKNVEMFNFFKELVAFRKNHGFLTLSTRELINESVKEVSAGADGLISYKIEFEGETYWILHTTNSKTVTNDGRFELLFSNDSSLQSGTIYDGDIALSSNTSVILMQK